LGSRYTSKSATGYNATPPSDDGATTEANKVKWSTIKNKLTDPPKVLAEAINTAINTALDYGPISVVSAAVTLGASHNNQFIEMSGASTPTLGDAATLGAGWFVDVKNTGSNVVTVARTTSGDMINDVTADVTMNALDYIRFVVNAAADGFNTVNSYAIATLASTQTDTQAGTRSDVFVTPESLFESGTWTTQLTDTSNDATHNASEGYFTRIGNVVHYIGRISTTSLGSVSGALFVSGLPYTASNATNNNPPGISSSAGGLAITAGQVVVPTVVGNAARVQLDLWDATTGTTPMQETEWSDNGSLTISGSYFVD